MTRLSRPHPPVYQPRRKQHTLMPMVVINCLGANGQTFLFLFFLIFVKIYALQQTGLNVPANVVWMVNKLVHVNKMDLL